jgi:hypothetical protein
MEKFSKETVGYRKVVGSPKVLRDAEFEQCYFEGGALVQYDDPTCGFVVKSVILRKCRAGSIVLHGVRFEDVTVAGLTYRTLLHLESCLFERVTLRGPIGPIQTMPANYTLPAQMQAAFREEAVKFYAGIEWALDISHAEFSDADFTYIPGNLVRRDPETQFLVHREAALSAPPSSLPGLAAVVAERAGYSPYDTIVAVAPTRSKDANKYRAELQVLRDRSIAE